MDTHLSLTDERCADRRAVEHAAAPQPAGQLIDLVAVAEQSARDRARADAVFFAALRQLADAIGRR